jgi:hypothetical protein
MSNPFAVPRFPARQDPISRDPPILNQPPVADFSYSKAGLVVTFTDESYDLDGEVVEWAWDFGDAGGFPTAEFAFASTGLTVDFTAQSSDPAPGSIASRLWTFGDGTTSTAANPSKTYGSAGSYNVILQVTDNEGHVASRGRIVTISAPGGLGKSLASYALLSSNTSKKSIGTANVNGSVGVTAAPGSFPSQVDWAIENGLTLMIQFAGGSATNYLTNGIFDPSKWEAKIDSYNTQACREAIARGVAADILLGNLLLDEPGNQKWGGYFTSGSNNKAKVDALATYAKGVFPTIPQGITLDYSIWEAQVFSVMDFQYTQYRKSKGLVTTYRDNALALGTRDSYRIVFGLNVLDGGEPGWPCGADTGGTGTYEPNCRMLPSELQSWGITLGTASRRTLQMWRYQEDYFNRADVQTALANIAAALNTQTRQSLFR